MREISAQDAISRTEQDAIKYRSRTFGTSLEGVRLRTGPEERRRAFRIGVDMRLRLCDANAAREVAAMSVPG